MDKIKRQLQIAQKLLLYIEHDTFISMEIRQQIQQYFVMIALTM